MTEKINIRISYSIAFLAIALIGVYYFELIHSISSGYIPVWSDEFFYYVNSKSFVQNNTLVAALTYNGTGSIVFGADAHGFAYTLLHGGIAKIVGWSNLNFIYFNRILLAISVLLISVYRPITIIQKITISSIILLYPFTQLYGFTYMQEIIHVVFAIGISLIFYSMILRPKDHKYVALFVLTIFVAGMFRSLWFFWLVGLLPLATSKKQFFNYLILFSLGVLSSFLFTKYFVEPVPNYFSSLLDLISSGQFGLATSSLFDHLFQNLSMYFMSFEEPIYYIAMKFLTAGAVVYFIVKAIMKKERLYISLALIGTVNFALLFVLYDAFSWREIRTMSPLFYFLILFIVIDQKRLFSNIATIGFMILFIMTLPASRGWINDRNQASARFDKSEENAFNEIRDGVDDHATILVGYLPRDYSWDVLYLPITNKNNTPIRYIIQYYTVNIADCDYLLRRPLEGSTQKSIINNGYLTVIKNNIE